VKVSFDADFSTFRTEVDQSTAALKTMDTAAVTTSAELTKMVDDFQGEKIIAQANLMAEAVAKIGGAANLSDAELKKVGATAVAAADRFMAFGKGDVPANIQGLIKDVQNAQAAIAANAKEVESWGATLIRTSGHLGATRSSFQEFNNLLALSGVHLGNQVGALAELGAAATGTAGAVTALGAAGLVVGTAISAWNLGRAIADLYDLDSLVDTTTADLRGWGNVAKEEAAAAAETLGRASRLAGQDITSMAEAVAILTVNEEARQRAFAGGQGEDQLKKWMGEVELVVQSGSIRKLEADVKSHNFTMQQLSEWYHISVGSIQFFEREMEKHDKAQQDRNRRNEQQQRDWERQRKEQDDAIKKHEAEVKRAAEETERWRGKAVELEQSVNGVTRGLMGMSKEAQDASQKGFDLFTKMNTEAEKAAAKTEAAALAKQGLVPAAQAYGLPEDRARGLAPMAKELAEDPLVKFQARINEINTDLAKLAVFNKDAVALETIRQKRMQEATDEFTASLDAAAKANDDWIRSLTPKGTGMFEGGEDITEWSALRRAPLAVKPIVAGSYGGVGGVNMNVQISGIWDARSQAELGEVLTKSLRGARQLPGA